MTAAAIDMQAIDSIRNAMFRFTEQDRKERSEGAKEKVEEILEKKEEREQSEEREERERIREEMLEERAESEEAKAETPELDQRVEDLIAKNIREDEERIPETIDDMITVFEDTGLLGVVENLQELVKEGGLQETKEEIKELMERERGQAELIKEMAERIEEISSDKNAGVGALSDEISELAKKDKGEFGKGMDELAKDIRGMTTEEAIDKVKDFIHRNSSAIKALGDLEKLLDQWDKTSQQQIADKLNGIAKELRKDAERLEKGAAELRKLTDIPEEMLQKAKKLFEGDKEMLEAIRRTWIGSIIDYTKEKLLKAGEKKDKEETEFWKNTFAKASGMRDRTIEEFDKGLADLLKRKPKDLAEAKEKAAKETVERVGRSADDVVSGRYIERLERIAGMANKDDMRDPVSRLLSELRGVRERIGRMLKKAESSDLQGIFDELGKPYEGMGATGRIMVKTVSSNGCRTKREMIRELMGEIGMRTAAHSIAQGIEKAVEKGDYELVDELSEETRKQIGKLKSMKDRLPTIMKMKKTDRRKALARMFAPFVIGNAPKGKKRAK